MRELKRLLRYARPHVGWLFPAVAAAACVGLFEAGRTALIKPILDGLAAVAPPESPGAALAQPGLPTAGISPGVGLPFELPSGAAYWYAVLGAMIGFTVLRGASQFLANYVLTYVGQRIIVTLRRELFVHFLAQSAPFFSRHRTADLSTHIVSDVEKMQLAVSQYLADALREGFTLVCLLGLAFWLSWKLTLVAVLVAPPVAAMTALFGKHLRRTSQATQEGVQEVLAAAQERLAAHHIVKAFGTEPFEERRFVAVSERLRRANLRTARALFLPSPIMDLMGVGIGAVVVWYTHHLISTGDITVGGVTATLAALFQLYDPVRKLSQTHNAYSQVSAAAGRVFALLDEHTELKDDPSLAELDGFSERIEFANVTFAYPGADQAALRDVSFTIERGRTTALVGRSGSGKSTVLNLLLRFHDFDRGRILIDGHDIRAVRPRSVRSLTALVSQKSVLFQDDFRYNIAYGRPEASPGDIEQAARAAFAHEFIMERGGYDALVGEAGKDLSGGQQQRIAVARALLKNAPILLLDEATSALDSESERQVRDALANLMRDRTTLVIAHRLSTVQRADKIVVLDKGRVVEQGTHETLLAADGLYRKLYAMQFRDAPEEETEIVNSE